MRYCSFSKHSTVLREEIAHTGTTFPLSLFIYDGAFFSSLSGNNFSMHVSYSYMHKISNIPQHYSIRRGTLRRKQDVCVGVYTDYISYIKCKNRIIILLFTHKTVFWDVCGSSYAVLFLFFLKPHITGVCMRIQLIQTNNHVNIHLK